MNLCIHCKHHRYDPVYDGDLVWGHRCASAPPDPVDGEMSLCAVERESSLRCGSSGSRFEPKEGKASPRPVSEIEGKSLLPENEPEPVNVGLGYVLIGIVVVSALMILVSLKVL